MRFYRKLIAIIILGWLTVGRSASSAAAYEELGSAVRRLAAVDCEWRKAFGENRRPSKELEGRRQEACARYVAASYRWQSR
jgi:hypothetical protein